jgi:hypothetical protein
MESVVFAEGAGRGALAGIIAGRRLADGATTAAPARFGKGALGGVGSAA